MRKKLFSLLVLPLLVLSLLSVLSVNVVQVSAVESPRVEVFPWTIVNPAYTPGTVFNWTIRHNYAGNDIWGCEFSLTYNPVVLEVLEVHNGGVITNASTDRARFQPGTPDNEAGKLSVTTAYFYFEKGETPNVTSGTGILALVEFNVTGTGDSDVILGDETKLIGANVSGDTHNIIDYYTPKLGHLEDGYFANTDPIHDVAVTSINCSKYSAIAGEDLTVTAGVKNWGNVTEEFDVTAYYGTVAIGTQTVNLAAGGTDTLSFIWDTSSARGNLTVSAEASAVGTTVDPELTLDNNTKTDGKKVLVSALTLAVEPDEIINITMVGGSLFSVNITITDAFELYMAIWNFTWVDSMLDCLSITKGTFLEGAGSTDFTVTYGFTTWAGVVYKHATINYSRTDGASGKTGSGLLATVNFEVKTKGGSPLELNPPPPGWWTAHWYAAPILVEGIFINNYDVQCWGIVPDRDWVYTTWSSKVTVKVSVTPRNNGWIYSTFNITVWANETFVATAYETLEGKPGSLNRRTYTYDGFNFTGFDIGLIDLYWNVTDVDPGDLSLANNEEDNLECITIRIPGDINGDGVVDFDDFITFAAKYGSQRGDEVYIEAVDFNYDGVADFDDFITFAAKYGQDSGGAYP